MRVFSVAGYRDEIEGHLARNSPRQIGKEENRSLEDAYQVERLIGKIPPDLPGQLLNAGLDAAPGDEHAHLFTRNDLSLPSLLAFHCHRLPYNESVTLAHVHLGEQGSVLRVLRVAQQSASRFACPTPYC